MRAEVKLTARDPRVDERELDHHRALIGAIHDQHVLTCAVAVHEIGVIRVVRHVAVVDEQDAGELRACDASADARSLRLVHEHERADDRGAVVLTTLRVEDIGTVLECAQ